MGEIKEGNVKEFWAVSYPMMVSFFSMMLMIFVDRIFLSWYSTESLNASVQAGTLAWAVILGWSTMATMSEVFVAQFNGGKKYDQIGIPVWQMIWLTLASYLFYIPLAIWGAPLIYDPVVKVDEFHYFQTMMFFGPIFALVPAIGGFYIGLGKTKILQWLAILGNIVNIILDPIFIFGIKGFFPSLGITGAAISTGIGTGVEVIILFMLFLRKEHREKYQTLNWGFHPSIFRRTIRIGLPPSFLICLEILGWAVFYHLMATISNVHIFVASICQTIILLFFFFGMGLEKGAIALTGNFIGANKQNKVKNVFFSGLKLLTIYTLICGIFLIIYPDPLINWFLHNPESLEYFSTTSAIELNNINWLIRMGLFFSTLLLFFENLRWVLNGILTAAGDTLFLLISGTLSVWFILILPTYFFVVVPKSSLVLAFFIWVVYGFVSTGIIGLRFLQGKWKTSTIMPSTNEVSIDS